MKRTPTSHEHTPTHTFVLLSLRRLSRGGVTRSPALTMTSNPDLKTKDQPHQPGWVRATVNPNPTKSKKPQTGQPFIILPTKPNTMTRRTFWRYEWTLFPLHSSQKRVPSQHCAVLFQRIPPSGRNVPVKTFTFINLRRCEYPYLLGEYICVCMSEGGCLLI